MLEAIIIISVALNIYFLIKYVFKDRFSRKTVKSDIIADGLAHDDKRVVLMTVLLTLSARLAKADGEVLHIEKDTMTKHLGLVHGDFQASNSLFDAACDSEIPDDDLLRILKQVCPRHSERENVVELLRQIAWSDDELHEEEQKYINSVAEKLEIN